MEGKLLQKTKVNVSDTDYNKNTIGNQLSTEQLYLGYMYDLEETLLHHDVFIHIFALYWW